MTLPLCPSRTKFIVGGTYGKRLGISATWRSESDEIVDTADSALTRVGDTLMVRVEWSGEAVALLALCNESPSIRFVAVWRRDLVMLPSGGPMSESSGNKNVWLLVELNAFSLFCVDITWDIDAEAVCFSSNVKFRRGKNCPTSLCHTRVVSNLARSDTPNVVVMPWVQNPIRPHNHRQLALVSHMFIACIFIYTTKLP